MLARYQTAVTMTVFSPALPMAALGRKIGPDGPVTLMMSDDPRRARLSLRGGDQAMAKRARAGRLRIHVENSASHAAVYHITPALLGRRLRRSPGLAGRIAVTYGQDPARLDRALADAEVLVASTFDTIG